MEANYIVTPVGRIVQGDCFTGRTTDAEGHPLVVKNGPNAGQPRTSWYIGLAVPKSDVEGFNALWGEMHAVARASFPNLFDAQGNCVRQDFAFKLIDGDNGRDQQGRPWNEREGFAGHWVFKLDSGFAPGCYQRQSNGQYAQLTDPASIKRGYYVRAYINIKGNESTQRPGIYLNMSMIELIGYGEEITSGPDAGQVFGGTPAAALPAGASATPLAPPSAMAAPGMAAPAPAAPGMAAPAPAAPGMAAPAPAAPGMAAPAPAAPATDFVNVGKRMTAAAGGVTYDAFIAAGWTDAQLVAQGMMLP